MDEQERKILGLPFKDLFTYWQHYWSHIIDVLIDKDNVSFKIIGPRMLIQDLIDELEGQGLANKENISFFRRQLNLMDRTDEVFHSLCHPVVACLLERLGDKGNRESCILLCKKILNTLVEKNYFTLLVDWLAKTIDETSVSNYDSRKTINDITHLVIAAFSAGGFAFDEIKKYANEVPEVLIQEGGCVLAAPPEYETLKLSDFPSEEAYYEAVAKYIKNRNVYQCLNVLKYFYDAPLRDAYFVVRLNGLKGLVNDYIGDINVYSPKMKKYITGDIAISQVEDMPEGRDRLNAAIPIHYKSYGQAKTIATTKLEEVLDLITLSYRTKEPVTIATNIYAVVADGNVISSSYSMRGNDPQMASRDEMMSYLDALDLAEIKEEGFKFLSGKHHVLDIVQENMKRRFKNAIRWYTKASTTEKSEDVLLYSWYAIEGLLKVGSQTQTEIIGGPNEVTSLKVIQEVVASIINKSYFHNHLRGIYGYYLYVTAQNNNYYDLSDDVIKKAALNLTHGDHYRDADFLNAIPDMMGCINNDIAKDELADLQRFYQDGDGMRKNEQHIKDDILMIYRLRNMIVHNAAISCENITFYAQEAKFMAQSVIRYVLSHAAKETTIDDIVIGAKLDYQVFWENIDEELRTLKQMN